MFEFGAYRTHMHTLNMYEIRPKSMCFVRYPTHLFTAHSSLMESRLTVSGILLLQDWLFPRLHEDNFIFQQDGAPPHWSRQVREYLNETLPNRQISRQGAGDLALLSWPPRSPDLTPCDFFLWGFVKDNVYVPPLPHNLEELKNRIRTAITPVSMDMLTRVWEEFEYRCNIVRVAGGGHIEHL